jgi:hypothetical protein
VEEGHELGVSPFAALDAELVAHAEHERDDVAAVQPGVGIVGLDDSSATRGSTNVSATGWSTATSATSRPTGASAASTRNAHDMYRAATENGRP